MFVRYEDLNHRNCKVQSARFVKSVTRRPKVANIWVASDLVVEAKLHVYANRRIRKWSEKWENKPWSCGGWCSASHAIVFVTNEKLYRVSQSGNKEINNPWLLKHIMKNVFKERK